MPQAKNLQKVHPLERNLVGQLVRVGRVRPSSRPTSSATSHPTSSSTTSSTSLPGPASTTPKVGDTYNRMEWYSTFIANFENGNIAANEVYFKSSIPKKVIKFGRVCARRMRGKLLFSTKITRTLKNYYFLLFPNTFLWLQRTICQKEIWKNNFKFQIKLKWAKLLLTWSKVK